MLHDTDQDNTHMPSTERSDPEFQAKMYDITLDWLRNPPLVQIDTRAESSFFLTHEERKRCTDIFDATITDFYKKDERVEFLPRVRPVERVVYQGTNNRKAKLTNAGKVGKLSGVVTAIEEAGPGGPQDIMEDALDQTKRMNSHSRLKDRVEYTKDELCFRWIHLPANNVSFHPFDK
jgi:hypothetical protein